MSDDYPFLAEYAKSSRASCKGCKTTIEKDTLRIGVMIQSPSFDGRIPLWHHFDCFFQKKQITSTDDLGNYASLRYEDQKRLKDKVGCLPTQVGKGSTSKGKGKPAAAAALHPFSVEVTKAGRASCKVCQEKILKGEIRISKLDCESETARRYGPSPGWHHVDCFVKVKDSLDFNLPLKELPGFQTLEEDDQQMLKKKLKVSTMKRTADTADEGDEEAAVPNKKVKKEKTEADKADKAMKIQSDLLFAFRDKAEAELSKEEIITLLEENDQHTPSGMNNLLDALADCFVFGPLRRCSECNGKLRLKDRSYKCQGQVTEWTNCLHETDAPKRGKTVIPKEFSEDHNFLKNYKFVKRTRLFPPKADASSNGSSSNTSSKQLNKFKIALVGFKDDKQKELEDYIISLGGEVAKKISKTVTCVVASEDNKEKYAKGMQMAKKSNITVVAETFLTAAKTGKAAYILKNHSIKPWGVGIPQDASTSGASKSGSSKSGQKTKKIVVQGVAEPDPDSGLSGMADVVVGPNGAYNAVLGMVNVTKGTNSFYKIQLLKQKATKKYYVFRAWGRVGTTIGGNKCENFNSRDDAVAEFERLYDEKTGNEWICKDQFVKKPNLFYPLDIDYGQDDIDKINKLKPGKSSNLHKKVQELICLIFDVNAMKRALTEFEIDLEKMPLGKLSKKQIMKAYEILTELQNIFQVPSDSKNNKQHQVKILDASNRFYTLIPHDFGLEKPPLLDSEAIIQSKTTMLDSLLEIECAYKLLSDASSGDSQTDPVDLHYQQLKTDIETLSKQDDEFKYIENYLKNTHAPTHCHYDLVLEDVFKINRHGEIDRYKKKSDDMSNKKLLWHGSRLTNFAGILSQGLRIAPPEAPVTGYMFGKGIYFADMVSKSANYCYTNKQNPTGLLLLCEVALGNIVEKLQADSSIKLPKDKHSTKGLGATQPNPKQTIVKNGVEIPCGKPVKTSIKNSSLLYNEYIVYDVNQVNIKYLLKVHFNHKF